MRRCEFCSKDCPETGISPILKLCFSCSTKPVAVDAMLGRQIRLQLLSQPTLLADSLFERKTAS